MSLKQNKSQGQKGKKFWSLGVHTDGWHVIQNGVERVRSRTVCTALYDVPRGLEGGGVLVLLRELDPPPLLSLPWRDLAAASGWRRRRCGHGPGRLLSSLSAPGSHFNYILKICDLCSENANGMMLSKCLLLCCLACSDKMHDKTRLRGYHDMWVGDCGESENECILGEGLTETIILNHCGNKHYIWELVFGMPNCREFLTQELRREPGNDLCFCGVEGAKMLL